MPVSVSRRRLLALVPLAAGAGLAACARRPVRASDCAGYAALGPAALKRRQAYGYLDATPDPAQRCRTCRNYRAPAGEAPCGGCGLLAGPVAPGGYCAGWAGHPA